ncbi:MAG: protein translocase subunit SecD [Candidatus Harrisonbacteria bacterium CG10_big_fil_rev_8_21_14_0_10_45_28]|uniref:Protein translocase subunit SecD n=1 Tax=Candidatus Harrisonbacteria bacterium CG10_big_fil_rev_8_21_14_0_10_45_28 TaxID=1974586 RepID=A0A2H0UP24_9BACT|nr:MAG: protein translocase subunit SecD [Candidatus Harrisonbacteria bacterium CG10_big_fil_rev_8_21_14_0_10_45_28]
MYKKKAAILLVIILVATVVGAFFINPNSLGRFRPWRLGLDLVGGSHLIYEVDMSSVASTDRDAVMNGLRDVIERRVNLFGVSEPQVLTEKVGESYRLVVELAGISDISQAILQIGETPFLVFAEQVSAGLPAGVQFETESGQPVEVTSEPEWQPSDLTGRYVKGAQFALSDVTRQPEIYLEFNSEGAGLFEELTGKNIGSPLAIFLDGALLTAPTVQGRIAGGKAQITGQFTIEEARSLVERFNAGALPAPIRLVSQETIGASLGQGSLTTTLWAGLLGTLLVILFMLIYYRRFGIYASVALIIYIILLGSVFKLLGVTLTLAGIAGIVLSIGMAVDANILIFERSFEELKKGSAKETAISEGFRRAWPSIRDSNLTTIITAVILYSFTSSFVKGFAVALLLGVIISMFSAITITKSLLTAFTKNKTA